IGVCVLCELCARPPPPPPPLPPPPPPPSTFPPFAPSARLARCRHPVHLSDARLLSALAGACSDGVLKRAMARAAEECTAIRPGSVFVFDEEESGIKRWRYDDTAPRGVPNSSGGDWLVYRELERKIGRRAGGNDAAAKSSSEPAYAAASAAKEEVVKLSELYDPPSTYTSLAPMKIRIPVRRILRDTNISPLVSEAPRAPNGPIDEGNDGNLLDPNPQGDKDRSRRTGDSDNEKYASRHLEVSEYPDPTIFPAALCQSYNRFTAEEDFGGVEHTTPLRAVPFSATPPHAMPSLLSLPAYPSLFDSDNDYDEPIFSTDVGSEDSYFMVEYMCNRGYSQQQFIIPPSESDFALHGV
ncbi:MAG: hypothetical protein BJ554DRAFT_8446, partial [Olpidium bornovanus]